LKKPKQGLRGRRKQANAIQEIKSTLDEDEEHEEIDLSDVVAVAWWREREIFKLRDPNRELAQIATGDSTRKTSGRGDMETIDEPYYESISPTTVERTLCETNAHHPIQT